MARLRCNGACSRRKSGHGCRPASGWLFALTPYVWLPNLEATGDFETPPDGGRQPHVDIGPVDYLERLELSPGVPASFQNDAGEIARPALSPRR